MNGIVFFSVAVATATIAIMLVMARNRFVRLRTAMEASWSGLEVEMQRRYDLIPNLVATAKGYMAHERATLDSVVEARERAVSDRGSHASQIASEQRLESELGNLKVRVEAYTDLKANEHFLTLQQELATTENRLASARRLHNLNVRSWNTLGQTIPYQLARPKGWEPEPYFEVADTAAASPVEVSFGDAADPR